METYIFNNGSEVTIDFEHAAVISVIVAGEELTCGRLPFYAVRLRREDGTARIITAGEGHFLSFWENTAWYEHEEIDVTLSVKQERNSLLWRIAVKNKTEDLLEWAEVMSLGVFGKLRDEEGGKGEIVYPYNEGALVTDMERREHSRFPYREPEYPSRGAYSVFPNMISSQFLAYIAGRKGIYLGMHDEERTTKHIDFLRVEDNIKLQMRTFCNTDYGEDYEMPFDSVMTFFEGNWCDACELYRDWFYQHLPKGLKKIADSEDLPDWYEESPIVVTYPVRGKCDVDKMDPNKLFPYKNVLPYLKEITEETKSKIMVLLMHWEGTAPWAPPYVWPPYGGEEMFQKFREELQKSGMLLGVYCSGLGWTQQSNLIPSYNKEREFENEHLKKIMCSDSDGRIESVICMAQRVGYDLCPACEKSKDMIAGTLEKLVDSGVDYVQVLDQNHGGNSYFCYNKHHGHIPAPGKWQVEQTLELLKRIQRKNVLLGCESAASEPFISALRFSDNRFELNYYIGLPIPVYSYLYHEYVNNFMGNQIGMVLSKEEYNYPYRLAYSFIAGDMFTVVLTEDGEVSYCWGNNCFTEYTDKKAAYQILNNLNAWRQAGGKNFLHLGKMVKPLPVFCGKNTFTGQWENPIVVDEVLTSAYEYDGKKMQFVVNYNSKPVTVMTEQPVTVYKDPDMKTSEEAVCRFTIPALSAVAISETAVKSKDCSIRVIVSCRTGDASL